MRTAVSRLRGSVHPCAWFQVQDPSEARLDLAHVSWCQQHDILRIFCVSTLVSPTVELSTPRKPTGRVTPMRQAKQCKVTYDGGYPTGPPRRPRDGSHPCDRQNSAKNSYNGANHSNLRATVISILRLLLGPTHRMAKAMIPSYHGVTRRVTVWGACGQ